METTTQFGTFLQILKPSGDRISRFLGTSPDDAHNRSRLIFFLIVFFLSRIVATLIVRDNKTVDLVKEFTSTTTWLVGIYVGGTVAAKFAGEPHITETHPARDAPPN